MKSDPSVRQIEWNVLFLDTYELVLHYFLFSPSLSLVISGRGEAKFENSGRLQCAFCALPSSVAPPSSRRLEPAARPSPLASPR